MVERVGGVGEGDEDGGDQWDSGSGCVGTLTHVVAHRPVLVVVKVDFSLSVCPGEEGVSQDPPRTVEGEVVTMPVPAQAPRS